LRITENIGLALEFFDENLLIVILVIKILVGQKEGIDDVRWIKLKLSVINLQKIGIICIFEILSIGVIFPKKKIYIIHDRRNGSV
jgi:hypothetical protein